MTAVDFGGLRDGLSNPPILSVYSITSHDFYLHTFGQWREGKCCASVCVKVTAGVRVCNGETSTFSLVVVVFVISSLCRWQAFSALQ